MAGLVDWPRAPTCDTLYQMRDLRAFNRVAETSDVLSRRAVLRLGIGGGAAAVVLAACGGGDEEERARDLLPVTSFTIVAKNNRWDLDLVVVPAGEEVTATVENLDQGIPHNLHVRSPGDPATALERGVVTQTLRFTIDEPGRYGFVCDAHPNMTGTIEAV